MGYWINPVLLIISARLFTQGLRTTGEDRRAAFIFSSVFFIWYAPALWLSSRQVKIRAVDRTIIFTHFFTRKRIVYYFTDIDGYVDMIEERPRGGPFRVLYLVKDERFIQRIPGSIYSNIDEIEGELKAAKYLGRQEFSWFKRFKIIFGRKVLNTVTSG